VAFLVFFFIRPPNPARAFAAGARIFGIGVANFLHSLEPGCDERLTAKNQHLVTRTLQFNQALADSLEDEVNSKQIDELLIAQYDVWQSLEMLQDSLGHLSSEDIERMPGVKNALSDALASLAAAFDPRTERANGAGLSSSGKSMNVLQIELLRPGSQPDRSWVYFGGVLLAGRRLETQTDRLRDRAGEPVP
jgi:hypothetical protein